MRFSIPLLRIEVIMRALPGRRPLRPRLNPALRRVWRDTATLQIGVDPTHALLVDGVDPATARLLAGLDGARTETEVLADATAAGLDAGDVTELLAGLHRGRALFDGADPTPGARRSRAVVVYGGGPVGIPVAALLGAAGVGAVSVVAGGVVDRADCAPGGLTPGDVRRPVRSAARDAIRRAAAHVDTSPLGPAVVADLAVIATGSPVDTDVRAALHAAKVPHLVAGVRESTAVIGPLVIPGRTSCLRCADLHRSDRDPSWPLVAAQLVARDPRHAPPGDLALALTAAGLAGLQALDFLDGGAPSTTGGSLELAHPDWRVRRRSWPPHPACGCTEPSPARPAGRVQVVSPHQPQWQ
jgi:bacteriocin biosynthesis cyclodehydratase domain-containing protein